MLLFRRKVSMTTRIKMVDERVRGMSTPSEPLQRSELSIDIKEILDLDLDEPRPEAKRREKEVKQEKIKCCPTVLGGTNMSSGCSQTASPRICSALHCRNCDLSVSRFPHHEWIERVEYLFLRTNMPNFEKVSQKLRPRHGSVAYACHCVSYSAERQQLLHEVDLPWFCRGHL